MCYIGGYNREFSALLPPTKIVTQGKAKRHECRSCPLSGRGRHFHLKTREKTASNEKKRRVYYHCAAPAFRFSPWPPQTPDTILAGLPRPDGPLSSHAHALTRWMLRWATAAVVFVEPTRDRAATGPEVGTNAVVLRVFRACARKGENDRAPYAGERGVFTAII